MAYFAFEVPANGITITLWTQQGSTIAFGTDKIQHPNSAFYNFSITNAGIIVHERGQGCKTLFVSVEGLETLNSFQLISKLIHTLFVLLMLNTFCYIMEV